MESVPDAKIRCVRRHELEAVVALCAEHAKFEGSSFSSHGKAEMLGRALFQVPTRAWCVVMERRSEIAGYAVCSREFSTWLATEYLHLDCLFLRSEHRDAGLGTRVMSVVAQHARDLGCSHVEWQTPAWNAEAARFYDHLGAVASPKLR